uniref:Protein kinase domain-containing protein n=1 Tax=Anabas testudineus TaxID=64144 RepID=A0A7N6ASI7_ANATE
MALPSCIAPLLIKDSSLRDWEVIGSGGFGQIYKARHHQWCCDVAIKLLHYDDGSSSSLLREVEMMRQGSSPYVIQVLGVFKGRPPSSGPSAQLGLVMEFMERGTLAFVQSNFCGALPWPLVFRLAHQVALGINFLHSLSPALLHLDLKPSNVLLDSYLNAKLTDFGLARFYHSVTRVSKKDSEEEGGTISYMPPEAFDLSYSPTQASDIYSYGILLWSIVTGKQPYANAKSSIVRFRIPEGDRPSLEEIRCKATGLEGLTSLMELMVRSWDAKPTKRPSSFDCTTVTEELFKMHKHGIVDAVHQVLKKLEQKEEEILPEQLRSLHIAQTSDVPSARHANVCHIDPTRSSIHYKVKASSVHPIGSSPPSSSTRRPLEGTTANISQLPFRQNVFPQYQRQFSSPDTFPCNAPAPGKVSINLSNVTGLQFGTNNTMNIYATAPLERRRHPTAPSSVDLPPPHSGGWKDKEGRVK